MSTTDHKGEGCICHDAAECERVHHKLAALVAELRGIVANPSSSAAWTKAKAALDSLERPSGERSHG